MTNSLTSLEIKILNSIQHNFPICPEPFKTLSFNLHIPRDEILNRIKALKKQGVIRRISPLFDTGKLGYVGTLVAMKVPEEKIEKVAKIIDKYPEITHNYERDDEYNLWFTLIARSNKEIEKIITRIKSETKINQLLNLERINKFKIRAIFQIDTATPLQFEEDEFQPPKKKKPVSLNEIDWLILKELQVSLPLVNKPYQSIARKIGISEKKLLEKIESYRKSGIIKRVRAVLDHYKIGIKENVMVVLKVEPENILKVATILSQYPQVTHCYERTTSPEWEYNLFAMIHARTKQECEEIISSILQKTNIITYKKLYTKRELKKVNPGYFKLGIEGRP